MVLLENEYALNCKEFTISTDGKGNNIISDITNYNSTSSSSLKRCVCDFRINFSGCEEEKLLRTLHWVLVPYCIIIILIAIGFLYYRIFMLRQSLWLPSTRERGILRPRPQEVFHIATIVFNLFHVIHLIMVLFDAYPNYSAAEIGQGLARELSIGLALIFPISMLYTTPSRESKSKSKKSRKSNITKITSSNDGSPPLNKLVLDIIGFTLLIFPITTLFPLTWLMGHYEDMDNLDQAKLICKIYNLIWVIWVLIFLLGLIYNWYKLIVVIWNHIKELKRKETSGTTSDLQWTVSTLRRAAIHLCVAISLLVVVMVTFVIMSFVYAFFHQSSTIFHYSTNITYMFIWNFTIPILLNMVQWFFLYKATKPKTKHPGSSIASKFTPTSTTRRKRDDDDESLISAGITLTPPTPLTTPLMTYNNVTINNNNNNNLDYFNHSGSGGLLNNAAAMNSMTNNILQNKTSVEFNRSEAYKILNSNNNNITTTTRSIPRSSSQILTPMTINNNNNNDDDNDDNDLNNNSIYPSFLTSRNDYNRNSIKRPLFIFSDEQNSNETDSSYNINNATINSVNNSKRFSNESTRIRRISKSSSSIGISLATTNNNNNNNNNNNGNNDNLSIRRISSHVIKQQKSFESSMGLIAEENIDGSLKTITTKKNRSNVSVSQESSDATPTTLVTTSTTFSASTTVSTTTTIISPAAVAAAKASWDDPDDIDDNHLSVEERKRLSESMEKREWLKRPVSPITRRKSKLSVL